MREALENNKVLVLAPGSTIKTYESEIKEFISVNKPMVISTNFVPEGIDIDYAFFSNNKRYLKQDSYHCKIIITSNLAEGDADYKINYNSVSGAFNQGCNSLIMLLKLLKIIGCVEIFIAGADGYKLQEENYYTDIIKSAMVHDNRFNIAVREAIRNLDVNVNFITPSEYNK